MKRFEYAAKMAGLDIAAVDMPFLVGGLAKLAAWHKAELGLVEAGKDSICDRIRKEGGELMTEPYFIEDLVPEETEIPLLYTPSR